MLIERGRYTELKAHLLDLAARRTAAELAWELRRLPFEPYAPIRGQFLSILRAVNRARGEAGREGIPPTCLRLKRRVYRPFEAAEGDAARQDTA